MKIGIYGGTFSPPTTAHIKIAQIALSKLCLDLLIVIPNGTPPHKKGIEDFHRFKMTQKAFSNIKNIIVSDIEMKDEKTQYSYDTLKYLKTIYPDDKLIFIMGADSLQEFDKWYKPDGIVSLADLAVFNRKGIDLDKLTRQVADKYNANISIVDYEIDDISSTLVRLEMALKGNSSYITPNIAQYIISNNLYQLDNNLSSVTNYLDDERLNHSIGTAVVGCRLARQHKVNENSVITACLLHDICKNETNNKYNEYPKSIRHAFAAADLAQTAFGINDEDIINAIRYHPTARANMSKLEKIVYTADKIEDGRNRQNLQLLCLTDFEKGFVECLTDSCKYAVLKHGREHLFYLTIEALNYYGGTI